MSTRDDVFAVRRRTATVAGGRWQRQSAGRSPTTISGQRMMRQPVGQLEFSKRGPAAHATGVRGALFRRETAFKSSDQRRKRDERSEPLTRAVRDRNEIRSTCRHCDSTPDTDRPCGTSCTEKSKNLRAAVSSPGFLNKCLGFG